jgi:hypothetical protein
MASILLQKRATVKLHVNTGEQRNRITPNSSVGGDIDQETAVSSPFDQRVVKVRAEMGRAVSPGATS